MQTTRAVLTFHGRSDLDLFMAINGDTAPAQRDEARRKVLVTAPSGPRPRPTPARAARHGA